MATSYSTLLGLALPTTGELAGTWGDTVNNYITQYLDSAVAGTQTLSTDADVTLTKTTNAALGSTSSQYAILNCTGARTVLRTITAPAASKYYLVINATTGGYSVKVVGAGPTTGVTIVNGERCLIAWNGSDFVKVGGTNGSGTFTDLSVTSGNLAFTSTAQRITGDMSNATLSNRLAFQTSTANSTTGLVVMPNGTGTISQLILSGASDVNNASMLVVNAISTGDIRFSSTLTGTGTYLPMTFYTSNSERMRIDTSGNVGIGTTNTGTAGLSISQSLNLSWEQSSTESIANLFRQASSAALVMSVGYKRSATANGFASSYGSSLAKTAISLGTTAGAITFYTDAAATTAVGTDVTPTERMRIDSSGNVLVGTTSNTSTVGTAIRYGFDAASTIFVGKNNSPASANWMEFAGGGTTRAVLAWDTTGGGGYVGSTSALPFSIYTNTAARLTIDSTGGITSSDLANAVGYKGTPLNEQSAAYTLVIGDMGKSIVHPASDNNARTFTIPANSSVAFPVGTTITFINMINTVTISITTDTLYLAGAGTTGSRTLAAYGMATAVKMTSTTWIISGNGLT